MSKKSRWDTFALACLRAIHEQDSPLMDWVCTPQAAKHNWDFEEPEPEGEGLIIFSSDPLIGEVEVLRKVLAEAGCKELGYAEHPHVGGAEHTFLMIIDAGGLQDSEVIDLTVKARKRLEGMN